MVNILRALMDKIDSMHEQMGNISLCGNPKKEPKRNAEIKISITERKNAFVGLIRKLVTAEEKNLCA